MNHYQQKYPYILPLIFSILYFSVVIINTHVGQHQMDLGSYYYGIKAQVSHLNPYSTDDLVVIAGKSLENPSRFVYTPISLYAFYPFQFMDYQTALNWFLGLKSICLLALLILWFKSFIPQKNYFIVLLILFFAFRSTLSTDIYGGNISIFEQLVLWLAFGCFLKKKFHGFAWLVLIVSCFKIMPILFLGLLLLSRKTWKHFIGYSLGFLTFNALEYALIPNYRYFFSMAQPFDTTGFSNPSFLNFIKYEVSPALNQFVHISPTLIYGSLIGLLVLILAKPLLKYQPKERMEVLILAILLYSIVVPRLKDYSFIILIIPAIYIVPTIKNTAVKYLVLFSLLVSFWPYLHLFNIFVLLFIFYKNILVKGVGVRIKG